MALDRLKIKLRPSPNIDARKAEVSILMLHYTGMKTGEAAIDRLCDASAKVSAHYVVMEDGMIWQLVEEQDRAWHAGLSSWRGYADVNSASIGIEIVNGGHDYGLPDFPRPQIKAVTALCKDILSRQDISPADIVGHSDVAPARKNDPGEKFPWAQLAEDGIGLFPPKGEISADMRPLFGADTRGRGVAVLQSGLAHIGYGAEVTGVLDKPTRNILTALQRRFRPERIDGLADVQTLEIITWLAAQQSPAQSPASGPGST